MLSWAQTTVDKKELPLEAFTEFLNRLLLLLNGVVEVEINCKWALVTLCEVIRVITSIRKDIHLISDDILAQRRLDILKRLCELDSKHNQRYRYLLELEGSN